MGRISNTVVRKGVVTILVNSAPVTALVPAQSIFGPQPPALPAWPFIQYGVAIDVPRRAACLDGQEIEVAVHCFAKGEEAASAIGAAVSEALDGQVITLTSPHVGTAKIMATGGQTIVDGTDSNSWHAIRNLRIRVLT
ncbi:MAG: DUF3168 domain-containing protein [Devosia sp.]|uniref:DUF3168 domain-containing protein n=1 Tax=Devosia sp. TaxID=1871048 RepID=UPI003393C9CB